MQLPTSPHALPFTAVLDLLDVDPAAGVGMGDAGARRAAFGANVLQRDGARPAWRIFAKQFASIILLLLAVAAVVAFATRDAAEGTAILVVLLLNAVIGFVIEWRSERALSELRLQTTTTAHVVRDGRETMLDAEEIVAGDIVILDAGARVPADARLLESVALQVEEAQLTGESLPVEKRAEAVAEEAPLPDRASMVYMGTAATAGRGRAVVTAVGEQTELGRIGRLVRESGGTATPLERQLAVMGTRLVHTVLGIAVVVIITGVLRGEELWSMIEFGISLAVAAVPEGLPAVTTLILAIGVLRMARQHAIVRRLPAVETLGSTTVICTDKTGTLTMNRLTVRALVAEDRRRTLRAAALCNDAMLDGGIGDPTELALLAAARDDGLDAQRLRAEWPRIGEQAFDPATKRMITIHQAPDGRRVAMLKGAPAVVLGMSTLTEEQRAAMMRENDALAQDALRVLAFGEKALHGDDPEGGYTFLGLIGMIDPPREAAAEAIARARAAGVRVAMLTGDQAGTARAIARELHLAGDAEPRVGVDVFSRVSPDDKLRIVRELRAAGEVVAVTGDGVNDAPALREADIGVAMGRTGTDVAKQSAALILTDDNLGTIVDAIEQGRTIYANIEKFVHLMFSHNLGEVLTVFVTMLAGMPLPLLPLQILWMNLVTDVFPAFALAMEPPSPETMRRPSRTALLTRPFLLLVAWQGVMLAAIAIGAYAWALARYGAGAHARTIALFALIAVQMGHTFNCRSRTATAFQGLWRNPHLWNAFATVVILQIVAAAFTPLARLLDVVRPSHDDLFVIAACTLLPIAIVEMQKLIARKRRSSS